ncbi:MAG: hypothetical protein ACREF8_06330, partial [Chthoniobacterales bacterium]
MARQSICLTLGSDGDHLAVDHHARSVVEASAAARAAQSRSLYAGTVTASLAIHLLVLGLVGFLERARPLKPDATIEVPVELVSDPAADKPQKGQTEASGHAGRQQSTTKKDDKPTNATNLKSDAKQTAKEQVKPINASTAKPAADAKVSAREEKPLAPPKSPPLKQVTAQQPPPKPVTQP